MRGKHLHVEQLWRLSHAVRPVEEAFGSYVWLVGSVLIKQDWRDVDLRVILADAEYGRMFLSLVPDVDGMQIGLLDQFRMLVQTSISSLLRQSTGLPIDFQVQSETEASQYSGPREPVCLRPYIASNFVPQWKRE